MPMIEFTPEELDLIHGAVNAYLGEYEGAVPPEELAPYRALWKRLDRELLVGKQVQFLYRGETLRGTLLEFIETIFSDRVAHIDREGTLYSIAANDVLGAVTA
jgi:hypothetical protein